MVEMEEPSKTVWEILMEMERINGKAKEEDCAIFFGIEHRLRKEEMEEQFNKEVKERWRFAADAARKTDETAGSEDRKPWEQLWEKGDWFDPRQ